MLQRPLQVADLFFNFPAAFDGMEKDVVGVAILFVPCVVQALEAGGIVLLQILQGLHEFVVGLSAGIFQRDPIGVENFQAGRARYVPAARG